MPTVPTAPAPPTWGSPPAAPPTAPPTWGTPPAAPPSYGTPPETAFGTQPPAPAKKSKAGLIVALLVLAFLVLAGLALAAFALLGSSDLELTIDRCEIAADGTLTASGTVEGPNGTGVNIDVEFVDIATDQVVDSDRITIDLGTATSGGDPWEVRGTAGDEVRQVACDVTADD